MDLEAILKGVSRSFYLSLRFLPKRVRRSLMLAFLACKAADTIADTRLLARERRLEMLRRYRASYPEPDAELFALLKEEVSPQAENPYERRLLLTLPVLLMELNQLPTSDWQLICGLVSELTQGMIFDLESFPGESASRLTALATEAELDRYTDYVAGSVGRFWTEVLSKHYRFPSRWNLETQKKMGEKFGKGLQLVNILRDLPRDLGQGRCYLPMEKLTPLGLAPTDLLRPQAETLLRPYLNELLDRTRALLSSGAPYAKKIPIHALRLRWVVLVPMRLGFQTLTLLESSPAWLDPAKIHKVSRRKVYQTMLASLLLAAWP